MNLTRTQKSLLLLVLGTLTLCNQSLFPNESLPHASQQETPSSPITPADRLIGEAQRQLDQIAIVFVTLSGIISTKQVTLANKPKAINQIRSITSFIHSLRDRKFADADIPLAYEFLHINNIIMTYALDTLNNNFSTIEKMSLDAMVKSNPMPTHIDIAQTTQLLIKNQYALAQLTYKIDNYGLRWYNKAYRVFDDYIISPCQRYQIPNRVLFVAGTIFFTSYVWRQINYDHYREHCPRIFQLGSNPPRSRHGVENDNQSGASPSDQPIVYNIYNTYPSRSFKKSNSRTERTQSMPTRSGQAKKNKR